MAKPLHVEIRIYKQHDTDLATLSAAGYPLKEMLQNAVISYAEGTPLFYDIDEYVPVEIDHIKSYRTRFTITEKQQKAYYMITHIKRGLRNSFCKNVLRNALIQQNLLNYFADPNLVIAYNTFRASISPALFSYCIPVSSLKKDKTFTFLGKEYSDKKEGISFSQKPKKARTKTETVKQHPANENVNPFTGQIQINPYDAQAIRNANYSMPQNRTQFSSYMINGAINAMSGIPAGNMPGNMPMVNPISAISPINIPVQTSEVAFKQAEPIKEMENTGDIFSSEEINPEHAVTLDTLLDIEKKSEENRIDDFNFAPKTNDNEYKITTEPESLSVMMNESTVNEIVTNETDNSNDSDDVDLLSLFDSM